MDKPPTSPFSLFGSTEEPDDMNPNASRDDLERWLDMLREQAGDDWKPNQPAASPAPAAPPGPSNDLPDWLADIAPRTEETNADFLQSFAREIESGEDSQSPISMTSPFISSTDATPAVSLPPIDPAPADTSRRDRPVPGWLQNSSSPDASSPIAAISNKDDSTTLSSLLDDAPGIVMGRGSGDTTGGLDWLQGGPKIDSAPLGTAPTSVPPTEALTPSIIEPTGPIRPITQPIVPETPAIEPVEESLLDWLMEEDDPNGLPALPEQTTAVIQPADTTPEDNSLIRQANVSDDEFLAQSDWLFAPEDSNDAPVVQAPVPEVSTIAPEPIKPDFSLPAIEPVDSDEFTVPDWMDSAPFEPIARIPDPEPASPATTGAIAVGLPPLGSVPEPIEQPDWLPQADNTPAFDTPAPAPAAEGEELPDWLQPPAGLDTPQLPSLGETPSWLPDGAVEEAQPAPMVDEEPSWLKATNELPELVSDSEPDWLKSTGELQPAPAPTGMDSEELPDWLQGVDTPTPVAESIPAPVAQNDLPDWLQGAAEAAAVPEQAALDEDISGWLADTGAQSIEIGEMDSTPDWLEDASRPVDLAPPAEAQPAPVAAVPSGVQDTQSQAPDWLSQISDTGQFEWEDLEGTNEGDAAPVVAQNPLPPLPIEGDAPAVEDTSAVPAPWETQATAMDNQDWVIELPGWLQPEEQKTQAVEAVSLPKVSEEQLQAQAKLEDALDAIPPGEPAQVDTKFDDTIFSALQDEEPDAGDINLKDLPEWLKPAEKQSEEEELDMPPWLRPTSADDIEWLNTLAPGTVPPLRTPAFTPSTQDDVDFIISAEAADPEWLEATGPSNVSSVATQPAVSPVATPGDLPDWLASVRPEGLNYGSTATPQAERTTTTATELFPVAEPVAVPTIPAAPERAFTPQATPSAKKNQGQSLEEADFPEIPPWLESIQPADQVDAPSEERPSPFDKGSAADFLDEISGALPVAPIITEQAATGTLAADAEVQELVVTDAQAKQAAIFEELFAPVAKPQTEPLPQVQTQTKRGLQLDRLIVAALVLIPLAVTFFAQPAWLGQPPIESRPAVKDFYDTVNTIPPGSEALVVFDYEPGSSADVDPAMEAVIAHLAQKGLRVALVAARPAAVPIAENTLQRARSSLDADFPYNYGQDWVHLGYLPGGALGAQALASAPQTTMPIEIKGGLSPWDQMLRNVRTFNQFELVIVGASTAERTRAWVEQVQVYSVPIGAVVPAGAEPLVLPYYESETPQLIGVISGVSGASVYDSLSNRSSGLLRTWSVYSFGILLAALLLFIGSIVWLISDTFAKQKSNQPDFAQIQKGLQTE